MTFITLCMIAYLVGAIPTGKIVARKYKGVDIQEVGTRNIGASNTYLTIGKRAAFLVLLGDLGKAFLMIKLAMSFVSLGEALIIGLFLVIGNMKSIFLRFTGGKGVATSLGIFLAAEPTISLIVASFWGLSLFLFKYMVIFGGLGTVMVPLAMYNYNHGTTSIICSFLICLLVLLKHRNLMELKGTQVQKV